MIHCIGKQRQRVCVESWKVNEWDHGSAWIARADMDLGFAWVKMLVDHTIDGVLHSICNTHTWHWTSN